MCYVNREYFASKLLYTHIFGVLLTTYLDRIPFRWIWYNIFCILTNGTQYNPNFKIFQIYTKHIIRIRQVTQHFYDILHYNSTPYLYFPTTISTSKGKEACNWNNILKITPYHLHTYTFYVTKVKHTRAYFTYFEPLNLWLRYSTHGKWKSEAI